MSADHEPRAAPARRRDAWPGRAAPGALEHGGGLDAAVARHGGRRSDWLDLSTGINPVSYPLPTISAEAWQRLPDAGTQAALETAARAAWRVPDTAGVVAGPGTSALIARIPELARPGRVAIPGPTYAEHAAAFERAGWTVTDAAGAARVAVHPNNPDGRLWTAGAVLAGAPRLAVVDESFCDLRPEASLVALADRPGVIVLKSLGKFWGLAGLRLGVAIGDPDLIDGLRTVLGPWPVAGPALAVGHAALADPDWAAATRRRLATDSDRLDRRMTACGAAVAGGTALFRLYSVDDARAWRERLARAQIWTRTFSYSRHWLRLGLPGTPAGWRRIDAVP